MEMMVDIHCNKVAHGSEIVPSSKPDHVGEMIHCNQMDPHGTEMDQGIEMIHGSDTNESATLTKSRCGSEMVSSDHGGEKIHCHETVIQGSEFFQGIETTQDNGTAEVTPPTTSRCGNDMDHSDEMIHCNQMVICGSEMVQGIDMTHGNYTGEAAPTTSRHCSEMVPVSKKNHGGLMTHCNQMIIHDREMVQGIEMTLGKNTAEVTPPTIAKYRRKNSIIWKHFTTETDSDGCTRACCKYCRRSFACSRTSGTSHLKRHLTLGSCPALKGQVPPSAGGARHFGSSAAEKPSKRQCTYADPADDALNRNYNISYLGKMEILTEVFKYFTQFLFMFKTMQQCIFQPQAVVVCLCVFVIPHFFKLYFIIPFDF